MVVDEDKDEKAVGPLTKIIDKHSENLGFFFINLFIYT